MTTRRTGICTDCGTASYLLGFANQYFRKADRRDVVWTYWGVRPLYDDGAKSPTAGPPRDYVLWSMTRAILLIVFGGKIHTFRNWPKMRGTSSQRHSGRRATWTAGVALPGGDFPVDGSGSLSKSCAPPIRSCGSVGRSGLSGYGPRRAWFLDGANTPGDLGARFSARPLTDGRVFALADDARICPPCGGRGLAPFQAGPAPDARGGRDRRFMRRKLGRWLPSDLQARRLGIG